MHPPTILMLGAPENGTPIEGIEYIQGVNLTIRGGHIVVAGDHQDFRFHADEPLPQPVLGGDGNHPLDLEHIARKNDRAFFVPRMLKDFPNSPQTMNKSGIPPVFSRCRVGLILVGMNI